MRTLKLILFTVASSFTAQALAQECADFSGQYLNVTDPNQPEVRLVQSGCDKITYIDNAGINWDIEMSGGSSEMPAEARANFADIVPNGSLAGRFANDNSAEINAKAHVRVPLLPGGQPLEVDVEAKAVAALSGGVPKDIQLSISEIKIVRITSGAEMIANGETNGFVQGANWILAHAKHALDIELKGI